MKRAAAVLLLLALGGCMADAIPLPAAGVRLDPIAFFSGRTEGDGRLHTALGSESPIRVQSVGRPTGRGAIVLTQLIREGGKAPRQRRWTIRSSGQGRYTGTLTDAAGPVAMEVTGGVASIRYRMKNGLEVDQQLALQEDERTLLNRLHVRKFGVTVARVDETIRKLD